MTIATLEKSLNINELEVQQFSGLFFNMINTNHLQQDHEELIIKNSMLRSMSDILEKMLVSNRISVKTEKIQLINLINKLKARQEYAELLTLNVDNGKDLNDLKITAERFGKKAQSAFEG